MKRLSNTSDLSPLNLHIDVSHTEAHSVSENLLFCFNMQKDEILSTNTRRKQVLHFALVEIELLLPKIQKDLEISPGIAEHGENISYFYGPTQKVLELIKAAIEYLNTARIHQTLAIDASREIMYSRLQSLYGSDAMMKLEPSNYTAKLEAEKAAFFLAINNFKSLYDRYILIYKYRERISSENLIEHKLRVIELFSTISSTSQASVSQHTSPSKTMLVE